MTRPVDIRRRIDAEVATPAQVWDLDVLDARLAAMRTFSDRFGGRLYYSIKAAAVHGVLKRLAPGIDGFACSSPFEARLSRQVLGAAGDVSITSPALAPDQVAAVNRYCDHVSFNSLGQMRTLGPRLKSHVVQSIRVNPGHSIVPDFRTDPCRENSRLGVPMTALAEAYASEPDAFAAIQGLHIHTATGNVSFQGLAKTLSLMERAIPALMHQVRWFNLGGGYVFDKVFRSNAFVDRLEKLDRKFGLEFVIEPGSGMVQAAARIVTRVVDIFQGDTLPVAVLDTSVSHMPDVLTFQFQPPVHDAGIGGKHVYMLAGASCLAGDVFGTYGFKQPLQVGQTLSFEKAGAYTHGQSNWFNGVNLPSLYSHSEAEGLTLERRFTFQDFARLCAVPGRG